MNDDLELSIQQFLSAWEVLGKQGPRYERASYPNVELAFSGIPVAFFNAAFTTGRGVNPPEFSTAARRSCEFAATRKVPWLYIVTHETLAPGVDPTARLDELGLAPLMNFTGMRAERVAPVERMPASLEIVEPQDDAGCATILDVNGLAYDVDLSASKDALGRRRFWKDHTAVIGRVDGKTVCSTVVLFLDGMRYVGFVATDPAHQKKGYADAVMRKALELSAKKHGEITTVLHATDAGRPVYERMGYHAISSHTAYIEKQYLEGH